MKRNVIYVGLDLDDTQYHGSALGTDRQEVIDFKMSTDVVGHRTLYSLPPFRFMCSDIAYFLAI